MKDSSSNFHAYVVRASSENEKQATGAIETCSLPDLPSGDVTIQVEWSSLNYKDALASQGHPGVVSQLPHVPGIDCAGQVVESNDDRYQPGDDVLVTGYGMGSEAWGGYAGYVRVPGDWPVPLPDGITARQAMVYGTAGFTAAQSVDALLRHGVEPGDGPVLVTGATGGVGILAVAILAKLGFEVTAMSGKADWHDRLRSLGATDIIDRDALAGDAKRPLQKSLWAGAVDTVGGETLAALVRSTKYRGCVTCCGLVAGADLPLTVYPFILRGVTLAGIDSAKCPREPRLEVWKNLAGPWSVELPEDLITEIDLDGLADRIDTILAGQVAGRTLVKPTSKLPL
ncbi:MAG: YhdH/YhfP family quinone oxidoreductase [Planctomycetota bacterium]